MSSNADLWESKPHKSLWISTAFWWGIILTSLLAAGPLFPLLNKTKVLPGWEIAQVVCNFILFVSLLAFSFDWYEEKRMLLPTQIGLVVGFTGMTVLLFRIIWTFEPNYYIQSPWPTTIFFYWWFPIIVAVAIRNEHKFWDHSGPNMMEDAFISDQPKVTSSKSVPHQVTPDEDDYQDIGDFLKDSKPVKPLTVIDGDKPDKKD